MSRYIPQVISSLALFAVLCAPAAAQDTTGQVQGTVRDESGAVLPGATVVAKHLQTGRLTEVVSNEAGFYAMPALQPGAYEITFTLTGFQPVTVKGIDLHVADRLEVNGRLGVSQVTETIEVSAATQFVQPSPAVQTLIGPTQVQELPLNNRNFVQLATLVPGVTSDLPDEVGAVLDHAVFARERIAAIGIPHAGHRRHRVAQLRRQHGAVALADDDHRLGLGVAFA